MSVLPTYLHTPPHIPVAMSFKRIPEGLSAGGLMCLLSLLRHVLPTLHAEAEEHLHVPLGSLYVQEVL